MKWSQNKLIYTGALLLAILWLEPFFVQMHSFEMFAPYFYVLVLVMIFLQAFFVAYRVRITSIPEDKAKKGSVSVYFVMGGFALLFIFLSILPLGTPFITVDEPRWVLNTIGTQPIFPDSYNEALSSSYYDKSYARSKGYWDAYLSGNIKGTLNNPNPSATLSVLHAPAYLMSNWVSYETYLLIFRLTIIFHNAALLLVSCVLLIRFVSARAGILFSSLLGISPLFVGYSRIINHDSILPMYLITFLIAYTVALQHKNKNILLLSGVLYAAANVTQYKAAFLLPIVFIIPIAMHYLQNREDVILFLKKNMFTLAVVVVSISLLIVPAGFSYPEFILYRLFWYTSPEIRLVVTFLAVFVLLHERTFMRNLVDRVFSLVSRFEHLIVRITYTIIIILTACTLIFKSHLLDSIYSSPQVQNVFIAVLSSWLVGVLSVPLIILSLLMTVILYQYRKPRFDAVYALILLFFALVLFAPFAAFSISTSFTGFVIPSTKYIFVFYPFVVLAVALMPIHKMKPVLFSLVVILASSLLIYENVRYEPYQIHYANQLLPAGMLNTRTVWSLDTKFAEDFFSAHPFVKIYSMRGRFEFLAPESASVIPWHKEFWKLQPDYVSITWETDHPYAKIGQYYRAHKEPLMNDVINGVIVGGIYAFDPDIDYEELQQIEDAD